MSIKTGYISELKRESDATKKILERIPFDKKDWKPHEKSAPIGRLATHVAENTHWISRVIHISDYDFAANYTPTVAATSTEELLKVFQDNLDKALQDLEQVSLEELDAIWTVRNGDQILYQLPKKVAIRAWAFSHMIHHRGQLSVYLRLLDIPVPGMYGPTADEG
ncbi:DinB family protein [Ferruginibacter lapsinanis]|uniref:DinB family protein n=1 Tax=Ferruginibacter lapsinanis TaxID=563172 RepID=UPI001E42A00F|nr:DinB family protein [Ferruginibacter lapsinanis]UEG50049.1 DinB family protein [Ferruginibacter lapsinanis]